MTDLPQWAMEKARQVIDPIDFGTPVCRALAKDVARALVEQDRIAEARGVDRSANGGFDVFRAHKLAFGGILLPHAAQWDALRDDERLKWERMAALLSCDNPKAKGKRQ